MTILEESIMSSIKNYFKSNLVAASYSLFIEPLKFISFEDNELILEIYSEWSKSIIDKRFAENIKFVVETLCNQKIKVTVVAP